MKIKVSDLIVDFLIEQGITDVFGYPGGMVTHLMESFSKKKKFINAHVNYHEQASAFSACGYAQIRGSTGVVYATSGPGATNLITGICNAYFDSVPILCITGQVNTSEAKKELKVRQKGFQETDIVTMVRDVTKFSAYINNAKDILYYLQKAFYMANEGRKGPVLLDIPMDVQRTEVEIKELYRFHPETKTLNSNLDKINNLLLHAKRPVMVVGAGVKSANMVDEFRKIINKYPIPVVTSMIAVDVLETKSEYNFGYIGAYGSRVANFIIAKSDLVITIGTRLDIRQTGADSQKFAQEAQIVRIDIDSGELANHIHSDELQICESISSFINKVDLIFKDYKLNNEWINVCKEIKSKLVNIDITKINKIISVFSRVCADDIYITTDVGQNQVWVAQSFDIKGKQKILFSGGHGAMGYSLPAAIGAYYGGNKRKNIVCFNGDGGIQMNIQELQFIAREKLPIMVVIINNHALGMIRHFQEMYFNSNYFQTLEADGYTVPDFKLIANAYGFRYFLIEKEEDINNRIFDFKSPIIVEISIDNPTYVYPKLEFGKPNQDQEPLLDRKFYNYLMEL